MRLGPSSKLIRWAFSSKTHRWENALESGSKRKRIHTIVLVWTVKNGRVKNNDVICTGTCLKHAHRVLFTSQRAIVLFSNVLVWTVENASKRLCGHESIDAFFYDNENAFFWKRISVDRAFGPSQYTPTVWQSSCLTGTIAIHEESNGEGFASREMNNIIAMSRANTLLLEF